MNNTSFTGKIIRGVGGFYYVYVPGKDAIYSCRARGIFRKMKVKPLPGDDVSLDITDEKDMEGSITGILPRKNAIIRPAAANVDQAMIIFAVKNPEPNLNLLDRFLLIMSKQNVETIICFNKTDLIDEKETADLAKIYENCGCRLFTVSVQENKGLDQVRNALEGKTTVIAGPSGVGKSSMTNALYPDACMQTGNLSEKIQRGKNTTRHTELFAIGHDTYLMDTPGFSTIYLDSIEKDELKYLFPEFEPYYQDCRFNGCRHINEPDCAVKNALEKGLISRSRYDNYKQFCDEIADRRDY